MMMAKKNWRVKTCLRAEGHFGRQGIPCQHNINLPAHHKPLSSRIVTIK
jgi:hypothetical protein